MTIWSLLLTVIIVLSTANGANAISNVYYIVGNSGTSCPLMKNVTCESLGYYIKDSEQYFTSNTTFYFLEGVHIINDFKTLLVNNVSNLALVGQEAKDQGQNDTQPKAVIKCSSPTSNILITLSNHITIKSLTITNCGKYWHLSSLLSSYDYLKSIYRNSKISNFAYFNITLGFIETFNVTLKNISVVDNSGFGVCAINAFDIVINESYFSQNNYNPITQGCTDLICNGGNIALLFTGMMVPCSHDKLMYSASIVNTIITYGRGGYNGFGAGLYIFMEQVSIYGMNILIDKVHVYNNTGNIVLETTTQVTHYEITIDNLISGYTETSGGGLLLIKYDVGIQSVVCGYDWANEKDLLTIINSDFVSNLDTSIVFNYGLLEHRHTIDEVWIKNVTISHSSNEEILIYGRDIETKFFMTNLTIGDHVLLSSDNILAVVSVFSVNYITFEDITINNSLITPLFAVDSNIYLKGVNFFTNNTGSFGGAIALYSSSTLFIMQDALVSFINNHAENLGGAIYIHKSIITYCFFQVLAIDQKPSINKTKIYFENNVASAGSSIYGGNIDNCLLLPETNLQSVVSNSTELFDVIATINDSIITNSVISSDPARACFCYQNITDCNLNNVSIIAYPGETVTIPIVTVGQRYGLSPGTIKATVLQNGKVISKTLLSSYRQCFNFNHSLTANINISDINSTILQIDLLHENLVNVPRQLIQTIHIEIDIMYCPPGFELSKKTGVCTCDKVITDALNDVTCNIQSQQITCNRGNMWMGYDSARNCVIAFANCSYDYCITSGFTLNISVPDTQCAFNRAGTLCGGCADGYSLVLGSNKCKRCSNVSLLLIVVFALVGIGLVALLILLNLTVSIGAINGVIFFANIVKINESLFFPHGPIPFLSQFISWLNLDFGIETCFYDGMNSTAKIWFQFVFPFYIWIIIAVVVFLSRYTKLYKIIGRQAVPVLATLTLLSYMKLFRIITIVLQSIDVTCGDVYTQKKWRFDPNIDYLSIEHLCLVIFTIFVLIFLAIPYTFILLFSQFIERYINKINCCHFWLKFKPIFDSYGGPCKDEYRFWTGLLLLVRLILLFVVSFSSKSDDVLTAIITSIAILIIISFSFWGVYQSRLINFSEFFFFILLITISALATTTNVFIGTHVILIMAFIAFVIIVMGHVYLRFENTLPVKKLKSYIESMKRQKEDTLVSFVDDDLSRHSTDITRFEISRRGSIIQLSNEDDVGGFYTSVKDNH